MENNKLLLQNNSNYYNKYFINNSKYEIVYSNLKNIDNFIIFKLYDNIFILNIKQKIEIFLNNKFSIIDKYDIILFDKKEYYIRILNKNIINTTYYIIHKKYNNIDNIIYQNKNINEFVETVNKYIHYIKDEYNSPMNILD